MALPVPAALPLQRTLGDERELGGKALHVLRLLGQEGEGDELREVGVLVPRLFEHAVQVGLRAGRGRRPVRHSC